MNSIKIKPKEMIKPIILILAIMAILLSFTMCKPMDIRSEEFKKEGLTSFNERKGKEILQASIRAQNLHEIKKLQTYQMTATDYWNKQLGMNLSPWPGDNGAELKLQFKFNSFDSRATWLEGDLKGETYGIQSWQVYHENAKKDTISKINDDDLTFILPTMHYFIELPYRLSNASIVSYMDEETIDSIKYDRVFIAWGSPEPNENDQYILYINKQNKRVERTKYTIRDNFMWTPKKFCGTAVYSDFRQVDGVTLPFNMKVYPFRKTHKKPVHIFQINELTFGGVAKEELYPFDDLPVMGDHK